MKYIYYLFIFVTALLSILAWKSFIARIDTLPLSSGNLANYVYGVFAFLITFFCIILIFNSLKDNKNAKH